MNKNGNLNGKVMYEDKFHGNARLLSFLGTVQMAFGCATLPFAARSRLFRLNNLQIVLVNAVQWIER
jgi:hypothetical protein